MTPDFKLYLITDRHATKMPLAEAVRLALEGGVRAVQLREKDLRIRELLKTAQELREVTNIYGAKLFINDRVDVAFAVGADGVHLGTQSMPVSAVRKIIGDRMLIGASTHNLVEAKEAEDGGADFITFGPIFETLSKAVFGPPVGVDALKHIKNRIKIPIIGIGGIKSGNIKQVFTSGAYGIAMISAIMAAAEIRRTAELINREIVNANFLH